MTIFHVSVTGDDNATGTETTPLRTIQKGAELARPGDTVRVHAGTYREWVKPVRGGLSDQRRITFEAAPGEKVVIKGSEVVTGWVNEGGNVWRADFDNAVFGDFNPFSYLVEGDWIVPPASKLLPHLADVYLNGKSLYEVYNRDAVTNPERRTSAYDHWSGNDLPLLDPDGTVYVWYAEVGPHQTTIWANFHGTDPNTALVEVNVRPAVFYPTRSHLDYITVRGFELAQAASPWTPPTADQPGLIGPNWAKGWIIEDNIIHDAKCSGVSLGKEITTGHNYCYERGDKPGYQYQLESVFTAVDYGWSKEHIGSHIVRRNEIYDCGQNGIVGHLGCAFSTIEDNNIYRIATKKEFYGYEIGGIKLHAALDTQIIHNRIHQTTLGIWLDWQVQGTRVSRNLMYDNGRDLFIEVSHGPATVDNNVFASPIAIELFSQGNAFINNLVLGSVRTQNVLDRATPYHLPHSTKVAGYAFTYAGDDRYVGNMFIGAPGGAYNAPKAMPNVPEGFDFELENYGTALYNSFPKSFAEYLGKVGGYEGVGDHKRFHFQTQAAYIWSNAYADGAMPVIDEPKAVVATAPAHLQVVDKGDGVYLTGDLPASLAAPFVPVITGADLGRVRLVDAEFETPTGELISAATDLTGVVRQAGHEYPAGPLAGLAAGPVDIRVW